MTTDTNGIEQEPVLAMQEAQLSRPDGKVIVDALTPQEIEEWWPIYNEPFVELNRTNPCRQSFTKEEFAEAMTSPTMAKLAYIHEGEIAAICLLSNDFSHFPWMSQEFYKDKYPEKFEAGQVYYFVSLLRRPDLKGSERFGMKVVKFITELYAMDDNEAIITFDCCDENSRENKNLPGAIELTVGMSRLGSLALEEVGLQHYYAGPLTLFKPEES